jgi:hypothetical protein
MFLLMFWSTFYKYGDRGPLDGKYNDYYEKKNDLILQYGLPWQGIYFTKWLLNM